MAVGGANRWHSDQRLNGKAAAQKQVVPRLQLAMFPGDGGQGIVVRGPSTPVRAFF